MTRADVHKLYPRTFALVVVNPGRVTCQLDSRAFGRWRRSLDYRRDMRQVLEPAFQRVTIVAPNGARPTTFDDDRTLAEWLRPDVGAMY